MWRNPYHSRVLKSGGCRYEMSYVTLTPGSLAGGRQSGPAAITQHQIKHFSPNKILSYGRARSFPSARAMANYLLAKRKLARRGVSIRISGPAAPMPPLSMAPVNAKKVKFVGKLLTINNSAAPSDTGVIVMSGTIAQGTAANERLGQKYLLTGTHNRGVVRVPDVGGGVMGYWPIGDKYAQGVKAITTTQLGPTGAESTIFIALPDGNYGIESALFRNINAQCENGELKAHGRENRQRMLDNRHVQTPERIYHDNE